MEISEIKQRLNILEVLSHYNIKPDKNSRICCPFHDDKTPSMQVYEKTGTVYCFSGNCKTHGKSLDVIDFIMHKEGISKHEALKKAAGLLAPQTTSAISKPEESILTAFKSYEQLLNATSKGLNTWTNAA
jgi:DNA primase